MLALTTIETSSWGFRMPDFAIRLLLITYFEDTLLPNGIYGFSGCGMAIFTRPPCPGH